MPILFQHDGKEFDIDDLPMDVYAQLEKDHGIPWYQLGVQPMRYAAAGAALARECAKIVGVELPTPIKARDFVKLFQISDVPNMPTEWEDGMPSPLDEE